jgi:hypothetical protein
MSPLRYTAFLLSATAALPLAAYAQQAPPPSSTGQAAPQSSTTTTTSRPAPSGDLNTDTNSQPDVTGTSGHPDTDIKMKSSGGLAPAMANFSVRTGLEIRPNNMAQVVVQSVRPDSPSARAGVEAGDVITNLNGTEISTIRSFQTLITKHPSQGAYFVSFRRGDRDFRVPLGRQLSLMGMTVFPDPADRPTVKAVERTSPADLAGFRVGDVITGVDRQDTATMAKLLDFAIPFIRNLSQGQGIPFRVIRDGKPVHFSVTRPADADLPLLTPDQERHLRRMADGSEDRARQDRPIVRKTTRTTRTKQGQMNSVNGQAGGQPNQNMNGLAGAGGFGGVGLGLDGGVGDAGLGGTGTGMNGASSNGTAVVAVLRATHTNLTQQTQGANSNSQNGGMANSGRRGGTVGFVQIQSNVGLNGNMNGAVPGANPLTGNTTTNTGVNPITGNGATNTLNPGAAATGPPQAAATQQTGQQQGAQQGQPLGQQGQQQQGLPLGQGATIGNGINDFSNLNGTNNGGVNTGINGTTNGVNGINNGVNGTDGTNGVNNGTNGTGTSNQSFVSAQISGVPAGTYTLTVNQFGDCGDSPGAAPGPSVFTLGTITVGSNGQGSLPNRTINIGPQAFAGRTVSLISSSGATQTGGQANGVTACGKFRMNQGNNGSIGGNNNGGFNNGGLGVGLPGGTTGVGTTGTGNGTATGTGTTTGNNTTGNGTATGTGTGTTAPGSLPQGPVPRPIFP